MFDVGFSEIIFFVVIAVIILGPDKFPETIRFLAKAKQKIGALKNSLNQTIQNELDLVQLKSELNEEIVYVKQLEERLNQYLGKMNQNLNGMRKDSTVSKLLGYKYYPIENFEIKIPFQAGFLLSHLASWACFRID